VIVQPEFTVRHLKLAETTFELHAHPTYTVATLLDGSMSGRIAERRFTLRPGTSALIEPQTSHEAHTPGCELVSVAISPVLVNELLTELGWNHPDAYPEFEAAEVADETLAATSRAFARELAEERPGQAIMIQALVRQLTTHLFRSHFRVRRHASLELSRGGPVDRRIRRAIDLVHARYAEDLTLQELAESVYLSDYHFARLFKDLTGFSPHAYLTNVRVERARALLLSTKLPVSQIALRVGYRSPSHFAHAFKAIAGVSPTLFRAGRPGSESASR
jgi:AraC family transcriptional regulator